MKKYLPIFSMWILVIVFAVWYFGYKTISSQTPIPEITPEIQGIKPELNPVEAWDPKLCETAPQWIKQICLDAVYLGIALKSKDIKDCNKIQENQRRTKCRTRLDPKVINAAESTTSISE